MTDEIQVIDHRKREISAAPSETGTLIQAIARAAADPAVDVDKMERLMAMHERMLAKQAETAFNVAMGQAQAKMGRIHADATNSQTKNKYATYAALDRAVRPIYTEAGFSLSFGTADGAPADCVRVVCYVSHSAGHTRVYPMDVPADGKGAKGGDVMTKTHALGSAMSYGSRYILRGIFNIAVGEGDDDGNAASTATLTEAQVKQLTDEMAAVHADEAGFLRFFKIPALSALPAQRYSEAMTMLKRKKGAK